MGDKCNCYRFSPRDSLSGAVAQIAEYLSKHPGWNETELKAFVSAIGVESFNGRTGTVTLDKNDVNNLKIASAYFAEGDESIDSLDLVSLYNQGVRFVFTDFNSVTHGYNLAFVLEYFNGSGNVVYYPISTASGGGGNILSVNGKTGEVRLKVVDVSNGNSPDENAYIFIDESDDYPDVISSDSNKLGGQLPSYYASAEEVIKLKDDILSKKISLVKIYENANTESEFGWQTIPIAGEGYDLYILRCKRTVNSILTGTNILIKGGGRSMIIIPDSSSSVINKRSVSISSSGRQISFDGGFTNASNDDNSIIPVSLYGVSING